MKTLLEFAAALQWSNFDCKRVDPADFELADKSNHPPSIPAQTLLGVRRFHCDGGHRVFRSHLFARRFDGLTRTGGTLTLRLHRDFLVRTIVCAIRRF